MRVVDMVDDDDDESTYFLNAGRDNNNKWASISSSLFRSSFDFGFFYFHLFGIHCVICWQFFLFSLFHFGFLVEIGKNKWMNEWIEWSYEIEYECWSWSWINQGDFFCSFVVAIHYLCKLEFFYFILRLFVNKVFVSGSFILE